MDCIACGLKSLFAEDVHKASQREYQTDSEVCHGHLKKNRILCVKADKGLCQKCSDQDEHQHKGKHQCVACFGRLVGLVFPALSQTS